MFSGWPFLPHLLQQQFQFFFHMVKRVRIPSRRIKVLPQLPDARQERLKAGFCFGLHGYTSVKSFSRTAAVTALPSPMTTRSPLTCITS